MYEVFEHTADLGLRVVATDLNALFAEGGQALFAVLVEDIATIEPREEVSFEIEGDDYDYLFFDWLNELLYTFESRGLLLREFDVQVGDRGLKATALGEPVDPERHRLDHEVKAITYHALRVEQTADGWLAEVVVDI